MERLLIIKNIFEIHPFYYLAALICACTGNFKGFIIFSIIIIVHEFGHLLAALLCKWKVEKVIILPFGGLTIFKENINKPLKEELFILLMGPIFQMIFTYFYRNNDVILNYSNIILFFNLLPIYPLDGSKILNIILNMFLSFKKSHIITIYISFFTIILFLIKEKFNIIIILIMSFIFVKLVSELKNHNNIFNKFLLERYIHNINFKKTKIIRSVNLYKMKRDYKHIFYNQKRYITEKEILKKRFDFHSKTW